jgi:tRNA-dihydrouridine synthase
MENPWLFRQIASDLEGQAASPPSVAQRLAALRRYRELLDEVYPEKVTAARLRGMACRIAKGFPRSAILREAVSCTRSTQELLNVLRDFAASGSENRTEAAA